jgi:hypothetical protein
MGFAGTARPLPRWHHATTELDDFAIISYRVAPGLIARHLPEGVTPEAFGFDDGARDALVSAVVFNDRDFHFRFFPAASMSCGQINYRTYVRSNGEPGVWFFGTSLDHPLVHLPRLVWGMPWTRSRIRISTDDTRTSPRWSMTADDGSGRSHCDLVPTSEPLDRLDGFADADEVIRVLTHPTDGWFRHRDGGVGRYSIWHDGMAPSPCRVHAARFTFLEKLGLITPRTRPHSAVTQPTIHFDIHTPPRRWGIA